MAETQTPAADKLRVLRAAQGILSEADARRSGDSRDDAHLDSFASASAGLMQLSSAAAAVPAPADNNSSNSSSPGATASADRPDEAKRATDWSLPPGWNRIIHGSGLPCYANYRLGVVCWSKPYALGADAAQLAEPDFSRLVKKHVPPIGIFSPPERAVTASTAASVAPSVSSSKPATSSPPQVTPPQIKLSGASSGLPDAGVPSSASASAAHPSQSSEEPANVSVLRSDDHWWSLVHALMRCVQ